MFKLNNTDLRLCSFMQPFEYSHQREFLFENSRLEKDFFEKVSGENSISFFSDSLVLANTYNLNCFSNLSELEKLLKNATSDYSCLCLNSELIILDKDLFSDSIFKTDKLLFSAIDFIDPILDNSNGKSFVTFDYKHLFPDFVFGKTSILLKFISKVIEYIDIYAESAKNYLSMLENCFNMSESYANLFFIARKVLKDTSLEYSFLSDAQGFYFSFQYDLNIEKDSSGDFICTKKHPINFSESIF